MFMKLLKSFFKLAILLNFLISLYMIVHLAADRFRGHSWKEIQKSILSDDAPQSNTLDAEKSGDTQHAFQRTLRNQLKSMIKCFNRDYKSRTLEHGDFWILKNYIHADHGAIECHESVTLTTHADFTFLHNLPILVGRWEAPISVALFAPGDDFINTMNSIRYLRDCLPESHLMRRFVTFHIYFPNEHIPKSLDRIDRWIGFQCSLGAPYFNIPPDSRYRIKNNLLYPANVARNIARQAALTHFVLASDIELYPSSGLVEQFFVMLVHIGYERIHTNRIGYTLPVFEVEDFVPLPNIKTELQMLYRKGYAATFHKRFCKTCQGATIIDEWIEKFEIPSLGIFRKVKRKGELHHWEPIFIGTHNDPYYEERMSWEGQAEKMPHAYILCVLNYDFFILDNAFLVHKPGVRKSINLEHNNQTTRYIFKNVLPKLNKVYGRHEGCQMFQLREKTRSLGNPNMCKSSFMKNISVLLVLFLINNDDEKYASFQCFTHD